MSQSASQAAAFYRDVARTRVVWTIKDKGGFPAPKTADGTRAQPFWSSRSRIERVKKVAPAYAGFVPYEVPWQKFCDHWVPNLTTHGLRVGVNWSGAHVRGYDIEPAQVQRNVEAAIALDTPENPAAG